MYPNFTFDYFPAQYYSRTSTEQSTFPSFAGQSRLGTPRSLKSHPVSFAHLVQETKTRMLSHLNRCNLIPKHYAQRESLHGKMLLEATEWSIQIQGRPIASLRMVYIHGGKNEIINTWIFPNRPSRMPVYAAELIAVNDAIRVAFVDIQVPALEGSIVEDTSMMTGSLAPRFASLPCNEAPPFWAIQESQGNFTYARNVPAVDLPTIEACYLAYMDAYLNHFACEDVGKSILRLARDEDALDALLSYQHHHMEHSPGNKFLSKLFGSDWTEAFMREFLFEKPQG
jgi:hypothetical protein